MSDGAWPDRPDPSGHATAGMLPVDRIIVPAAGLGTRLRPLTLAIPKEMLPLGRKPVLEYVVEEARAAGILRILFVVSAGKEMIRAYFGDGARLGVRCEYAIQPEMRGVGDAILHGESWSNGEAFAVAFGDCFIESRDSVPLARLLALHAEHACDAAVLSERVPLEKVSRYGILTPVEPVPAESTEPFRLAGITEKPRPQHAPSDRAVAARWTFGARIFRYLRRTPPGPSGEVYLTDAVCEWLRDGASVWAQPLRPGESRLDIGGWESYLTAAALKAADDPEYGPAVRQALKRYGRR